MTPAEYAVEVNRTRRRTDAQLPDETYLIGHTLGLVGEGGEVCDLVKKHVLHGHALDKAKLIKELGDVLWYNIALRLDTGGEVPTHWDGCDWIEKPTAADLARVALDVSDYAGNAKGAIDQRPIDAGWLAEALNDQLYELAALAAAVGVDLAHVAAQNIAKLRARFPEGFTAAASLARVDVEASGEQHTILPVSVPTRRDWCPHDMLRSQCDTCPTLDRVAPAPKRTCADGPSAHDAVIPYGSKDDLDSTPCGGKR